jgi:hypothetical protein
VSYGRRFLVIAGFFFCFPADRIALPESSLSVAPPAVGGIPDSSPVRANLARSNIDGVLAALSNMAMQERISRFAGTGGAAHQLDSFEAEVSIADGVEQYTGVKGPHRTYRHVSEIRGLWSFGEIVTMLRTSRDIIGLSARNAPEEEGPDQTVIQFASPSADRRWFVTYNSRIYWLDFEGTLRLSKLTGEIERLTWTSPSGPAGTGIASVLWDVNFHDVDVAGSLCTMPSDSIYRVVRKGENQPAEWNLTRYAALGRYGSSVSVGFGQ